MTESSSRRSAATPIPPGSATISTAMAKPTPAIPTTIRGRLWPIFDAERGNYQIAATGTGGTDETVGDGRVVRPFHPQADQFEKTAVNDVDRPVVPAVIEDPDGNIRIGIGARIPAAGHPPPLRAPEGLIRIYMLVLLQLLLALGQPWVV